MSGGRERIEFAQMALVAASQREDASALVISFQTLPEPVV